MIGLGLSYCTYLYTCKWLHALYVQWLCSSCMFLLINLCCLLTCYICLKHIITQNWQFQQEAQL